MNKGLFVALAVALVVALGGLGLMSMFSSAHDTAVDYEGNIQRYYDASENELSNYTLTIQDKTQISDMYVADLRSVIGEYFNGKQGVTEKQVLSFIQQHIPNLDSKIYQELLSTIESGRQAFKNTQNMKIEQCTSYTKFRKGFWNSKVLDSSVFPGKNVEHWCNVVSDKQTRTAMETGIQEPLKLR